MELIIDGNAVTIPFDFKALRDLSKSLGSPKVSDLEKMLKKIGFDNCIKLTAVLLKSKGIDYTEDQIENAIKDAGHPVRLIEAIGAAIAGPKEAVIKEIKSTAQGN
jgi:hypothetical protein